MCSERRLQPREPLARRRQRAVSFGFHLVQHVWQPLELRRLLREVVGHVDQQLFRTAVGGLGGDECHLVRLGALAELAWQQRLRVRSL